jgi:DNA-binding IclR family transcriptional regulator
MRPVAGSPRGQRGVQSAQVGGQVLLALAEVAGALPLKDLAARCAMPPSRVHPYLVSLQRLGLVVQEPGSGHYALGPAALRVGLAALNQLDPLREAEALATALAQQSGHALALAVWGSHGPTVVRLIETRRALHVTLRVGHLMALSDTATGRAFAACVPLQRLQEAAASGAHPGLQSGGDGDEPALRKLQAAAKQEWQRHGLIRATGRPIPGVNAFSAPVHSAAQMPALVMTMLDHEDRLGSAYSGPSAQALRKAALQLSRQLGA